MSKNAATVLGICLFVILIGAYFLFYKPVHAPAPAAAQQEQQGLKPVSFSVLEDGTAAVAASERKNFRITSNDELASVWSQLYGKKAALPKVDFVKNEVLAVLDGAHPTTGYAVSVAAIVESGDTRTVTVTHAQPDPSCKLKKAATSPFQVVVVPASNANLTHVDLVTTVTCK